MIVLLGSTRSHKLVAKIHANGWGRMFVGRATPAPSEPWALDNGVFGSWKAKRPWDEGAFLRSLDHARTLPNAPLFVVLPDEVGEGQRSLDRSLEWRAKLPSELRWFLALQDGMTVDAVRAALPHVDGLFLGGTDRFKATARTWCDLAHEHGKRFHFARISTERRYCAALDMGADSADTSQPLWSGTEWRRFEKWWRDANAQGSLGLR